ncbi:alanine racemase [Sphingomicrobium sp. XHP0239]|uniref:alanine racemase n=1 Tax=Sphingomicrobium maritimum TaxID=3133972 RepID=UPI0031CC9DD6
MAHRPHRLLLSGRALRANWRALNDAAKVETGAAIKADGYGLGAREVMERLYDEGAREFFVATWGEAEALGDLPEGARLAIFHGLGPYDIDDARRSVARPVLNSVEQVRRWRGSGIDGACDVMVDTGMNRLGLAMDELGALDGLRIDILHSHLACADEPDNPLTPLQRERFQTAKAKVAANRYSLANSAGIALGRDYAFDLVRPGLALYGGVPRPDMAAMVAPVARLQAQVVQRRTIAAGDTIGYNATYTAPADMPVAILNIGYADGYPRNMTGKGVASFDGIALPLVGRVSMDLVAVDLREAPQVKEGDWLDLASDPQTLAAAAGISQYEALTGMGQRFERKWVD